MDYSQTIPYNDYMPHDITFKAVTKGKKTVEYAEQFISLDTETAWNHDFDNPVAWIYQWALELNGDVVTGRRPSDFIRALKTIQAAYDIGNGRVMAVYVHNLSYDIQYLKQALYEAFGAPRMLCVKAHKFITYECGGFQFRCSWKLSNKSLSMWGNDLNVPHKKLAEKAEFYNVIHYQTEELPAENWKYQIQDVLCLSECIKAQMALYGDDITTIPLTSTGYVRRAARRHYRDDRRNRKRFINTRLYETTYTMCREAFAGAITHGNRFFAGATVEPEQGEFIKHRDFRSHYPSQQRTRKFPMGPFVKYGENLAVEDVAKQYGKYCFLLQLTLQNVRVKDGVILPYLSQSKVYKGRRGKIKTIEDNGRVLMMSGITTIFVTEIDLKWILKQYNVEYYNIDIAYASAAGYLPEFMRKTVDEFFLGKTKWKQEVKKAKAENRPLGEVLYLELELMKSKNGLNGIYGMSATDIIRMIYSMDEKGNWTEETPDVEQALARYYAGENNFNAYQWGVWTTAHARNELLEYAEFIQENGGTVLYVDTDSIFYVSCETLERKIEEENARREKLAVDMGAYIEYEGKRVTYDSFDDEMENITSFRFLHAKCYAYIEDGEKLKCVIAGVTAFSDSTQTFSREDELGGIDNLEKGFIFEKCGGTRSIYTENAMCDITINGYEVEQGAACIITDTTKKLNDEITIYELPVEWEVLEE